ncbi:hypothetical protein B0T13DRAFT_465228 [Neurospora crassa]|nr:hypothetical protein B0T13DRAFT_465228 [Neurospora crassa]
MRKFAGRILPEMEAVGWIVPGNNSWGAYTKFPLKSNGDLRVVMNCRPINGVTMRLQWPMHGQSRLFRCIATGEHRIFFQADGAHGYWGVPMARGHKDKTAFISPNGQYWNLRMPQGPDNWFDLRLVREVLLPTTCLEGAGQRT